MRILVTGAAGLVGAEVCARLVKAGHEVTGLVHHVRSLVANNGRPVPGVTLVTGDVTQRWLGLPEPARTGYDLIVHSAAITDFGRPRAVYESVNVAGTAHVLELAAAASARLVHVSTAYVCGERDGLISESELDVGQRFGNPYEESKFAAENLVRKAAADGLPTVVVRPSVVVGASRTGVAREFKNVYVVLKLVSEGRVRSVPGFFDAAIDLVPVDHVAGVVAAAVGKFDTVRDRTLHAVGASVRMRHVSDVLAEYPSFHVARYIAPATFDPASMGDLERRYWTRVLSLYESYFRRRQVFDDRVAAAIRPHQRVTDGPAHLRLIIDHAVKTGYLGTPLPGVDEALAQVGRR